MFEAQRRDRSRRKGRATSRRWSRLAAPWLLAALGASSGCTLGSELRDEEKHRSFERDGGTTLVVVDVSQSMVTNDPKNAAQESVQLIASLVEDGHNLGLETFSSRARIVAPIRVIRTGEDRRAFADEALDIERRGQTNFVAALDRAQRALAEAGAGPGANVVFMTDGEHNLGGSEDDVLAALEPFRKNGWKIHCIGYTDEARTKLLPQIAARTGGAVSFANTPKELFLAYLRITGGLQDLIVAETTQPIRVYPGTGRLVYVVMKGAPATRVRSVRRDDRDVNLETPQTYRCPRDGAASTFFEAIRISDPAPGTWAMAVDGPHDAGFTIEQPPFRFALGPDSPGKAYVDGAPVPIELAIEGDVDGLLEKSGASVTILGPDGRERARVKLSAKALGSRRLTFRGEHVAKLLVPEAGEAQTAVIRYTLKEGPIEFTHEKCVTFRVGPADQAPFTARPRAVDLGTFFLDDAAKARATFEVDAREAGVVVAPAGLAASVERLEPGKALRIEIAPAAGLTPGELAGAVRLVPSGGADVEARTVHVPVKGRALRLSSPSVLKVGGCRAGKRWRSEAALGVEGAASRVVVGPLRGPGAELRAALDEAGHLVVESLATLPGGTYHGTATIEAGGVKREVAIELEVAAAEPEIVLAPALAVTTPFVAGSSGTFELPLRIDYHEPCAVTAEAAPFRPAGGPGRAIKSNEVRLEALQGGAAVERVAPGSPATLRATLDVSSDCRSGAYAGKVTVTVATADGRRFTRTVDVTLTVTRS